jgi:hypothetical protein
MPQSPIEPAARLWLEHNGLLQPDGRPLYRYRLSRDGYESLKERLARWVARFRLDREAPSFAAAFCLFVAEWYKREFHRGQWSWDGPCAAIGLPKDQVLLRNLTDVGLSRYWRLRIIRGPGGSNEFLLSLVLQGGIPTAFAAQERGWLPSYIRQVLGDLEAESRAGEDAALRHAEYHAWRVPESFRQGPLLRLVSDLAFQLATLRAQMAGRPQGVDLVAWLDARRPDWRDELPIEMADSSAKALIEGLVREQRTAAESSLRVDRFIKVTSDGGFVFGVRLDLDGEVAVGTVLGDAAHRLDGRRVRMVPAGALADRISGCIAILDRSGEGMNAWTSRTNLAPRQRGISAFPPEADVEAVLRLESMDIGPFTLPGGQGIASDVLSFRLRDGEEESGPLPLVSTGSMRTRDSRACVLVAGEARERMRSIEGRLERIGSTDREDLYIVEGWAEVSLGEGLTARFVTGAADDKIARLEAMGPRPADIRSSVPLFQGWPKFIQLGAGGLMAPRADAQLVWRPVGLAKPWGPLVRTRPPLGLVEVASVEDGALQARIRMGLLPEQARVERTAPAARAVAAVSLSGFGPVNLSVISPAGADATISPLLDDGSQRIEIGGGAALNRETCVSMRWIGAHDLEVWLPLSGAPVAFHDASGRRLRATETVSLAKLRGMSIETIAPDYLDITLVEPGIAAGKSPSLRRAVNGSVPLSMLRAEIETLFSLSDKLDAEVRIESIAGRATARLVVRRFALSLAPDDGKVRFDLSSLERLDPDAELIIAGRRFAKLCDPELRLATVAARDAASCRIEVPSGEGPWLIYARQGEETVSRPLLITRALDTELAKGLRRLAAALVGPSADRVRAIGSALQDLANGADTSVASDLAALMRTYARVLPLQSFDVLVRLAESPPAAIALIWSATDDDLPVLLDLFERELPFSWMTTPVEAWGIAAKRWLETQVALLRSHGLDESHARPAVMHRINQIRLISPHLDAHLAFASLACGLKVEGDWRAIFRATPNLISDMAKKGLRIVMNGCVTRNGERRMPPRDLGFRPPGKPDDLVLALPDDFHELLDAPIVAAELALGTRAFSRATERGLRLCRLYDPTYVDEAFPYALTNLLALHSSRT